VHLSCLLASFHCLPRVEKLTSPDRIPRPLTVWSSLTLFLANRCSHHALLCARRVCFPNFLCRPPEPATFRRDSSTPFRRASRPEFAFANNGQHRSRDKPSF
ncbi:unnamed protein product, partial [Ectocarpus sp. 4 AP-2014]